MNNSLHDRTDLHLYRRRLIPEECVPLLQDTILRRETGLIVTSWKTIRPKKELDHGFSCYYLEDGYKISRFYRADHTLMFCYCDIISSYYEENTNSLIVTDLLADVVIYPDGKVQVVDLDELAAALDAGLITTAQLKQALRSLDALLSRIYEGQLDLLLSPLEEFDRG